ncbi:hypothetical protein SISNIDRAFT_457411, partial [Sistotremastrum niveocremeum HHB9708]
MARKRTAKLPDGGWSLTSVLAPSAQRFHRLAAIWQVAGFLLQGYTGLTFFRFMKSIMPLLDCTLKSTSDKSFLNVVSVQESRPTSRIPINWESCKIQPSQISQCGLRISPVTTYIRGDVFGPCGGESGDISSIPAIWATLRSSSICGACQL